MSKAKANRVKIAIIKKESTTSENAMKIARIMRLRPESDDICSTIYQGT